MLLPLLEECAMKRLIASILLLLVLAGPVFAKTHKDDYSIPCATLWAAVRDTVRNSGKYGIIGIDSTEMTASFNIGGSWTGKRINSVVLNAKGDAACEMQVQTAFSGLANNDYGDFKKRVDDSLAKLKASTPTSTGGPAKVEAKAEAKSEEKPQSKPEEKPETKSETKPQSNR
jgi:hypothetical protein